MDDESEERHSRRWGDTFLILLLVMIGALELRTASHVVALEEKLEKVTP